MTSSTTEPKHEHNDTKGKKFGVVFDALDNKFIVVVWISGFSLFPRDEKFIRLSYKAPSCFGSPVKDFAKQATW